MSYFFKDLIEYIFGEVDVPMLDDDKIRQPAFKSDRSGQLDLDSEDGQLLNTSANTINNGIFAHNLLGAFQSGINHGSVQIMRDQVGRRGLGLPRG